MWKKRLTSCVLAFSVLFTGAPAMALTPQPDDLGEGQLLEEIEWATPFEVVQRSERSAIEQEGTRPEIPGSANLAYNAEVTVSSFREYGTTYDFDGKNAVDGSQDTGWFSGSVDEGETPAQSEWLEVDLGETKEFNRLKLSWNAVTKGGWNSWTALEGRRFIVEYSQDKETWSELISGESKGTALVYEKPIEESYIDESFEEKSGRYVRFTMTKEEAATEFAYIWELELYNQGDSHALDVGAAEIFDLRIPKYVTENFTVPTTTSQGAAVAWTSSDPALVVDGQGNVQVKQVEANTPVTLTATISKEGVSATKQIAFELELRSAVNQLIEYKIFPEPQKITRGGGNVTIKDQVTLIGGAGVSGETVARAEMVLSSHGFAVNTASAPVSGTTNISLRIYDPQNAADVSAYGDTAVAKEEGGKKNEKNIFDAHIIDIQNQSGNGSIQIVGKHDDAVYYAIATIDQMLDQMQDGKILSDVRIEDYANTKWRGVVEGFYGQPYTAADIESLMKFGQKYKMNTFIYGPKADPYHASLWKEAYPTEATITPTQKANGVHTQEEIRHIAKVADENHINFVWSIHPMMDPATRIDITKPEAIDKGVEEIIGKFTMMRELGVKGFGMFVDDVDTNAVKVLPGAPEMARMIGNVAKGWKEIAGDEFRPVFYVPSLYCFESYWPIYHVATHIGPLAKLDNLDDIVLTFTGSSVFAPITNSGFDAFTSSLGAGEDYKWNLWWNSPVNDGSDGSLFIGPADQRFDMRNDVTNGSGVISNPMQQAEVSKVQIFGILDYAWNTGDFDSKKSWEASFEGIFGDDATIREAYRLFAKNSAPAEATDGSLKPSVVLSGMEEAAKAVLDNSTEESRKKLLTYLQEWNSACETLRKNLPDSKNPEYQALYKEILPWLNKAQEQCKYLTASFKAIDGDTNYANIETYAMLENIYASLNSNEYYKVQTLEGTGSGASDNRVVVTVGGESINKLLPQVLAQAKEKIGKVISSSNVSGVTAEQTDTGWTLSGLSGKSLKADEYIGITFAGFQRKMDLEAASKALPTGIGLQYTTSLRAWNNFAAGETDPLISGLRIVNTSKETIRLDVQKVEFPYYANHKATSASTTIGDYEGTEDLVYDGDWKTFYWSNESPGIGKTFTVEYGEAKLIKNLEFVMDAGDKINAEVAVELSEDGETWTKIGVLNGSGADGVPAAAVKKDGKNYQVFSVDNLNHTAKTVRLNFLTANGPWVKFCEITPNVVVPQAAFAKSGVSVNALRDGNTQTKFYPQGEASDAVTVYAVGSTKAGTFEITMEAGASLPTAELLSGNKWISAEVVRQSAERCTVSAKGLDNVEALRLSWTGSNVPKSIGEISYNATTSGGGSSGGSGGSGGGGGSISGGSGNTNSGSSSSSSAPAVGSTSVTTKTDDSGKATASVSTSSINDAIAKAKAADKAGAEKNGVTVEVKVKADAAATSVEVALPKDALKALSADAAVKGLSVAGDVNLQLDTAALKQVQKQVGDADVAITYQKGDVNTASAAVKKVVGDRTVYEFTVQSKDSKVTDLGTGSIEIRLPYQLAKGEDADNVYALYIDESGKGEEVEGSSYDKSEENVVFSVNHLSKFAVAYRQPEAKSAFNDIAGHWADQYILTVVERKLFTGVTETVFSPNAAMTRGMFVTVLGRIAEVDVSAYKTTTFSDTISGSYYQPYVEWASQLGVVKGIGNGLFAPDRSVTREEMAAIISNFAAAQTIALPEKNEAAVFTDAAGISTWAVEAVQKVQRAGIIEGRADGSFDPKGATTRAEVSAVVVRLLEVIE